MGNFLNAVHCLVINHKNKEEVKNNKDINKLKYKIFHEKKKPKKKK